MEGVRSMLQQLSQVSINIAKPSIVRAANRQYMEETHLKGLAILLGALTRILFCLGRLLLLLLLLFKVVSVP